MKIFLWCVTFLLAAVWTASIALLAAAAQWLANAGDQVVGAVQMVAEWPVPAWAEVWMAPAWLDAVRAALTWAIDATGTYAPWLFSVLGWVAPVLWAVCGLGLLLLLVVAVVGHILITRAPPT